VELTKYQRIKAIHGCVVLALFACSCTLTWLIWKQPPDDRLETMQTMFYPVYRWIFPLWAFALCAKVALDPFTTRLLRSLRRQPR